MRKTLLLCQILACCIIGCERGTVSVPAGATVTVEAPNPPPPSRLQEVYGSRRDFDSMTHPGGGRLRVTIIKDTVTNKEYIVTSSGGIVEIK